MAQQSQKSTLKDQLKAAKPMLLRATALGLCCGLMVIGLWENATRFQAPEELYAQARIDPDQLQTHAVVVSDRADRLDVSLQY